MLILAGTNLEDWPVDRTKHLTTLLKTLDAIVKWFDAAKVSGVIIGGVAASLLGRPRLTRDVDALVILDEAKWADFLKMGESLGFKLRTPDALEFAKKNRVLLMNHIPVGIDVDISCGLLPFEKEVLQRAKTIEISGVCIPLPSPEDLIIMKAIAGRPRDIIDIESLLDANPELNMRRVRKWIREFSKVLEMPEILENVKKIIRKHAK